MTVRFTTNSHRRPVLDSWDIPADVRSEFDYIDWDACDDGRDSVSFVRAYGTYWDLNDVEPGPAMYGGRLPEPFRVAGYVAYVSETYFSGVCFRYVFDSDDGGEYDVIVARYFSTDDDSGYSEQITEGS